MSRSISIFGLGYVGSVALGCLARMGHRVIGVDVNPTKVALLESGRSPIVEPGLDSLIAEGRRASRLRATTDATVAVRETEISFLCVGTPGGRGGRLDLSHVESACREIGAGLRRKGAFHLVAIRSTVPPGTTERVLVPVLEQASGLTLGKGFAVCVNPEFMREGAGVADFLEPTLAVIGARDPAHGALLREVYAGLPGAVFETSFATAEMIKYVGNAWHALKVSFANEIGSLAKRLQVDTQTVMEIFLNDAKLNVSAAYLRPGFAFGGSCLPKDLSALARSARDVDLRTPLLEGILPSNREHLNRAVDLVLGTGRKTIALLGLAFKAGTDDLRDSPQVELVKRLLGEGCRLRIWDADVSLGRLVGANRDYIESVIPDVASLLAGDLQDALAGAEVVIIASRGADPDELRRRLRPEQIVIDLVNLERSRRLEGHPSYQGLCW